MAAPRDEQARIAQLAAIDAQRAEREAHRVVQEGQVEARRVALPEQMQGRAAGLDLAPASRPRRAPKPIDRLVLPIELPKL